MRSQLFTLGQGQVQVSPEIRIRKKPEADNCECSLIQIGMRPTCIYGIFNLLFSMQ